MKKNIGKIKQWANERVGGQRTQTTDEFQELQQKTDERHSGIDKLHMATNTYIKIMSKKTDSVEEKSKVLPLESLGSTMKIYGEEIGTDTPYGMGLVRFGNANEKIAKAQMEYVSSVRDDFLFGLASSIEEFKQYQQLKRKLESRRLDYDAKLNKVQKSKKEKPELEEEMRAAKEKYEVTMEDINNKMFALNDSEDQHVQDLTTFLDAQLEYFKAAHEILESVRKDWVESSDKPSSRRKRTPIRSSTIDSTNSNSDGSNSDNGSADNGSANSHSSHNRPKPSKRTSKLVKSDSSNNLNIPTVLSRNKSVSSGSSTRSVDLKKSGNTAQKKQVRAIFSYEGEDRDELAIEEGDIITVLEEAEGWWIGEIIDVDGTKRSGMFPANYTEPIPVESLPPKIPARRPTNSSRQSSVEQVEEEQESDEEQEDDESDEQTLPKSKSSPPIRKRHSQTSASQRPGSPTAGTPPIPSRSSKPPPARSTSSTSVPPRKAARSSTHEYSSIGNSVSKTTTPPSITSRNSYIQDYVKETTTQDFGPCKECDCNDYSPNVFKKGSCKNCFHIHT